MRIRIGVVLVAVGLVAAGSVTRPAQAVGDGGDCGGPDTPPARHLASGETCTGSLDEPHVSTTTELTGLTAYHYEDAYTFDQTDGDRVQVTYDGPTCSSADPSGTSVASTTGVASLTVTAKRTETPEGAPAGNCPNQPGAYDIRVTVTPNDRPAVQPTSVPQSGGVEETLTFEVSGTDPDGNLTSLGARFGNGPNIEWKTQLVGSSSWSTTFEHTLRADTEATFYARDSFGAVSPASATYPITLVQDDCGLGHDAHQDPVDLPLSCDGYLPDAGDVDSFVLTPSPGMRAKASLQTGFLQGYTMTLTSPTGVLSSVSDQSEDPDLYGTAEAGQWRLDVRGDGDPMHYLLSLTEVGDPAAPSLVIEAPPVTHQGDWYEFWMTGYDPNGQTLRFQVDWGGAVRPIFPVDGRAESGERVLGIRLFVDPVTSASATVTVTNSDGLSSSASFSVTIRLHDDCGYGPVYDAPGTGSELPALRPEGCSGTVGHVVPDGNLPPQTVDAADGYASPLRCGLVENCKLRATLTTAPGLAASVAVEDGLRQAASSCGAGGCTTTVDLVGPTLGAGPPRVWVRRDAGRGDYTVTIEKLPIEAGLVGSG
jgi:hypothetical protein